MPRPHPSPTESEFPGRRAKPWGYWCSLLSKRAWEVKSSSHFTERNTEPISGKWNCLLALCFQQNTSNAHLNIEREISIKILKSEFLEKQYTIKVNTKDIHKCSNLIWGCSTSYSSIIILIFLVSVSIVKASTSQTMFPEW